MEMQIPAEGTHTTNGGHRPRQIELDRRVMDEQPKDMRWIPVNQLNIHYNTVVINGVKGYQRPLSARKIDKMIEEWDPQELTAIVVSERPDGTLWIIDGQHRWEALKQLGKQVVLADVRSGLTFAQEARLFYRLNAGTTKVGAWDQFQSRLHWDPIAQAINKLVEAHGYRLDRSGNSAKAIAAVASIEKVYRRGYLDDVLGIVSTVWRTEPRAVDGPVIEGMGIFLHSYREQEGYDRERLLDTLAVTPVTEIIRRQRQLVVEMGHGTGQPAVIIAMAIRDVYNGRRRGKGGGKRLIGAPISGTGRPLGYAGRGGPRTQTE